MTIRLSNHKTKIVCTIGPNSRSRTVVRRLLSAGMNVARLNFSHGTVEQHREDIEVIRSVAGEMGKVVPVLADLPGPKIRIGELEGGAVTLTRGLRVTLTTAAITGTRELIPVQYAGLPQSVKKGGLIFLNDGFIQLKVLEVSGAEVHCRVLIGGLLLNHKGLNLPGAVVDVEPVTSRDLELVDFGLEAGVDAFCISFCSSADDLRRVREHAAPRKVFLVAKVERREALKNIDAIIDGADGIMMARGDLGVEIPLAEVPVAQKRVILKSNVAQRPVITATQMLESMTENIRPTRAEVTDVANAILDGTDAVMLSEETAIGRYPVDACRMLARIASTTEQQREKTVAGFSVQTHILRELARGASSEDVLSLDALEAVRTLGIRYVLAPTVSGGTPRRIARYKSPAWIFACCDDEHVRNTLQLSYGVMPILKDHRTADAELVAWIKGQLPLRPGGRLLIARRLPDEPEGKINALKIVTLP